MTRVFEPDQMFARGRLEARKVALRQCGRCRDGAIVSAEKKIDWHIQLRRLFEQVRPVKSLLPKPGKGKAHAENDSRQIGPRIIRRSDGQLRETPWPDWGIISIAEMINPVPHR